jgi:hypothetical protein
MAKSPVLEVFLGLTVCLTAAPAAAAVIHVPRDSATIQEAVDGAQPGDKILVAPGRHCGAVIGKPVQLLGLGHATIVGCETGPFLAGSVRIGFLLNGSAGSSPASGTTIAGFTFDGRGVSNENLTPLAFGVLGRFASHVSVVHNRFLGTGQAITNTAGDYWLISQNSIEGLTVFDCPGLCTGGDGIVIQLARGSLAAPGGAASPANRPEGNAVLGNRISGSIPDGFDAFGMVGVMAFSADKTAILHNTVRLRDNPDAEAPGQGILVTNICCGEPTVFLPGSRWTWAAFNDVDQSEIGIVVEGSGGQNTEGLVVRHNRGSVVIEGVEQEPRRHHRFPRHRGWKVRWF